MLKLTIENKIRETIENTNEFLNTKTQRAIENFNNAEYIATIKEKCEDKKEKNSIKIITAIFTAQIPEKVSDYDIELGSKFNYDLDTNSFTVPFEMYNTDLDFKEMMFKLVYANISNTISDGVEDYLIKRASSIIANCMIA